MNVVILAGYRLQPYRTDDLTDVEDIVSDLLSYSMIPDALAAQLTSFRDDVRQALDDRAETK